MRRTVTIVMFVALLILFLLDLLLGPVRIPMPEVLTILMNGEASKGSWERIVLLVRVPQAITAICAGAGLATCGLLMQTLFRNPLAGPSVLGISSGASLAVAIVVLVAPNSFLGSFGIGSMVLSAFIGSIAVMLMIILADKRVADAGTLLIIGLMLGYLCSALVSILELHSSANHLKRFILWGMGSFSGVGQTGLWWLLPMVCLGLLGSLLLMKPLNAMLLGKDLAYSMGVNAPRSRTWILLITGLLAGGITAFCGPIAFLGLAVPHVARALFRSMDHRILLPATMLCGAVLALLCDLITKFPGHEHAIPLNAVTSMLGAPVVIWVLIKGREWYRNA